MPNEVVALHRQAVPDDPHTDQALTLLYGDSVAGPQLAQQYPQFGAEYQQLVADRKAAFAPSLPQEFASGVSRGISSLESTGYGALGLASGVVGADALRKSFLEKSQQAEQDAAQNPPSVGSYDDIKTANDAAHYLFGKAGELLPNLAEAGVTSAIGAAGGAAVGTEVEPGGGTVVGAGGGMLAGLVEKQAIKSLIRKGVINGLEDLGEPLIQKQVKAEALNLARTYGNHIAQTANFWAQSAGGTYNTLAQNPNVDPGTAIDVSLLGGLAQAVPAQYLPSYVTQKFFGAESASVAPYFVRLASEAAKTIPGGMAAMSLQELGSIASEKYADPSTRDGAFDLSTWNKGDLKRLVNASATGGLAGLVGAPIAAIPRGTAEPVKVPEALSAYTGDLSTPEAQVKVQEMAALAQQDLQGGLNLRDQQLVDSFTPDQRNAYLAVKQDVQRKIDSQKALAEALGPMPKSSQDFIDQSDLREVTQRLAKNPSPLTAHPELDDTDVLQKLSGNGPEINPVARTSTATPSTPTPEIPASIPVAPNPNLAAARSAAVTALNPEDEGVRAKVERAAAKTNPTPTVPQIQSGNYAKGKVNIDGLDIAIENPEGGTRTGKQGDWQVQMPAHYGELMGTRGADGDPLDVYIGPKPEGQKVFVVDQADPDTGLYDESKIILGFDTKAEAQSAYEAAFSDGKGPLRRMAITETTKDGLKDWIKNEDTTKPFAESLSPKPDWRVVVQGQQGEVPGYVQIINPRQSESSQSPTIESLRAAGHEVPDFSRLPTGKYSYEEATKLLQEAQPAKPATPVVAKSNFENISVIREGEPSGPDKNAVVARYENAKVKKVKGGWQIFSGDKAIGGVGKDKDSAWTNALALIKGYGVFDDQGVSKVLRIKTFNMESWRKSYDEEKDASTKTDILRRVADRTKSNDDLSGVLDAMEQHEHYPHGETSNIAWAVQNNPHASEETVARAKAIREQSFAPSETEPTPISSRRLEPTDIDFGNTTIKSNEKLAGEPSFFRINESELDDARALGERLVSGARSKVQTDPYQMSRRLTAVEDHETGKVYLLSTFKEKRGGDIKLTDPVRDPESKSPYTTLTKMLGEKTGDGDDRFTPIASMRTADPQRAYAQEYPDRAAFEDAMGKPADQQMQTIAAHAQTLEAQHEQLMRERGIGQPVTPTVPEEDAGFGEQHAETLQRIFGNEKELLSPHDFNLDFKSKIAAAGRSGYDAVRQMLRYILDSHHELSVDEAMEVVIDKVYENLKSGYREGPEAFKESLIRSFRPPEDERPSTGGSPAVPPNKPVQPQAPSKLGTPSEQKSGAGNPVVNNPTNLSFRQPEGVQEVTQHHAILLDSVHRAAIDAGLNVVRIGQDISGMAGDFAKRTGAAYDSASRTVAQVVSDVVGREDVVTSLHEVAHDVFSRLSPEMQGRALRAIDGLGDRQLGLDISADPRIRESNVSLPNLAEERLVESASLRLADQGFDPSSARGVAQQFVRALKDLYLRAAISIQRALFGDEFINPDLARQYFENRVKQFLAGDFNRNSFIEMLGGGNPPQSKVASWHDNGRALFERLGVNQRPEYEHVPDLTVDSARLNNLVFRQPNQDAADQRVKIEMRSALFNHQLDMIQRAAKDPAVVRAAAEARMKPEDFIVKRLGLTDPMRLKIELARDLTTDSNPAQYDPSKKIDGFKGQSNADRVARDAYVNAQAMESKVGRMKTRAQDTITDLADKRDKILAAHEEAKSNYTDWNQTTNEAVRQMQSEGRRLFSSIAGDSKRMGVIEQQLRAIDPNADLKKYGPVFQKLFTGNELKGEHLFTLLDRLANDPKIDLTQPMLEIRRQMFNDPAYAKFIQGTPESNALTATVVAFAKTNARVMANLELRRMANGQQRQDIASRLDNLRQEKGTFLNNFRTLAKTAKLEDRVRQAYRQSLQQVRSMNERMALAKERIASANALRPILESEQSKLAGKLAIGVGTNFGDGTMYAVPSSPKAATSDLLDARQGDEKTSGWSIKRLMLDTSREKVTNPEEVESHLRQMAEFLNFREEQFANGDEDAKDTAYQSVKNAFDEIAANKNYRLNVTPSDRFMLELGVLGPGNKVADAFGTPSARAIGTMVNRETTALDAMRPEAERIWRKNEQLEDKLIQLFPAKMANKRETLRQDFLNPAKKTMQSQRGLAEQYAGNAAGLKAAIYNRAMDMLLSNEATSKYVRGNEGKWREGLINLLEHQHTSNKWFEQQARGEGTQTAFGRPIDTGHGVADTKVKAVNPVTGDVESATRHAIPVGPYTFAQKFSQGFRGMVNALRNSGWVNEDGESLAAKDFGKISDTLERGGDVHALVDKYFNHPIHGDTVQTMFLRSLAEMDTESPFDAPKADDGTTQQPADIAKVLEAWKQSDGDPLGFAGALYDLHGGQDIHGENGEVIQDKGTYVQSIMERMAEIADESHKLMQGIEPDPNDRRVSIRGMMSDFALNARQIEHLPGTWFDYHSYDQRDTFNMMKRVAVQTAFGRNSERLAQAFDNLNHEVAESKYKLQNMRQEVQRANPSYDSKQVDKAVADKIGAPELKRLKQFSDREKFVRDAISDLSTYHRRDNSPDGTVNFLTRMMHFIGSMMINQPSSAISLMTQLSDVNLRYGASKSVAMTSLKSFGSAGKEIAASLAQAMGLQMFKGGELHDLYYRLGLQDPEMVRSMRDAFGKLEGENRATHFLRAASDVLGTTINPVGEKAQHVPFQPFKPFDMMGSVVDQKITEQVWQLASQRIAQGMDFYRSNLDKFGDTKFKLSPEAMGLRGADRDSFNRLTSDMSRWDLDYDDMVRGAIQRGDKTALTNSEALRLYSMAVSEIALRGSLSRSSASWYNNNLIRMAAPLIRWSFDRMVQVGGLRLNQEGQTDMRSLARGVAGLSLAAGGGLAVSALLDQYYAHLVGKQRNLRPIVNAPNPQQAALGVMEDLSRVGTFGMFGELANSVVGLGQGGDNRVLSVDQRVLAVSSLQSIFNAADAWANQGFNADYSHVVRPLMGAVGGGGLIQYMQLANNALGLDNAEARVTARINAQNYLRVVGRQLGMDVRVSAGGGSSEPTPITPYLTAMELAAYKNDPGDFREAYRQAVMAAKNQGQDDPVEYIKRSFSTRNPLRAVFAASPTQADYERLLSNMPGTGRQDVSQAVRLFNEYAESIGAKGFDGKTEKEPKMPSGFGIPTLQTFRERAAQALQ